MEGLNKKCKAGENFGPAKHSVAVYTYLFLVPLGFLTCHCFHKVGHMDLVHIMAAHYPVNWSFQKNCKQQNSADFSVRCGNMVKVIAYLFIVHLWEEGKCMT